MKSVYKIGGMPDVFMAIPSESIDYAVMEHKHAEVLLLKFHHLMRVGVILAPEMQCGALFQKMLKK
jgi:hypothetical protein